MFTHLHNHTEYSLLDGISRIPDLVSRTRELGMDAMSITDHGSMYGVVDFYSECKQAGIKPVIGCEMYLAPGDRRERTPGARNAYHHLVLLAQNNEGYRNLLQLVTLSHLEGFHYKPRIDKELLERHRQGLICLSGCPSAEVPKLLAAGDYAAAREQAGWHREIFGENYFLELQSHAHVPGLPEINDGLLKLHRETRIPLLATNDAHYVRQDDYPHQDVYICIQTSTNVHDEKRLRMEDNSYYIKSPAEMAALFPDCPQAMDITGEVAQQCQVSLGFGQTHLPRYPTPNGEDADAYLETLCREGFGRRYGADAAGQAARARLDYELEVVRQTSFANYFLVVWDIISFVRRQGILFGVRGSAAASVALYCLGITDIDPMRHKLVFERFLNLERKEMPDIDMDFQDDRRDEVLRYVIDRYGRDRVAHIITFGTMGPKGALRDVGRGLGMSYRDVDRIAKMASAKARTLAEALAANPEMERACQESEDARRLLEHARALEGSVHHVGAHAAGVLICDEPLSNIVPLQRPARGDGNSPVMMTQYSMDPVAKLGLLKMDFLGLTNLTILDRTVKLLEAERGVGIDLIELSLEDPGTYEMLGAGETADLFQLESSGMQRHIKELKPSDLGDIAAMIALYRPGPMEHIDRFIRSKHGKEKVSYPHPSMKDLLDETYGVIVYQDQVLQILQNFAGYSLGEADIVRKAMGKKIPELMAEEKTRFIAGARERGYDEKTGAEIFSLIEPFAGYAFNKAHSVSYGLISYWTAYFKRNYPLEYMVSALNCKIDHPERYAASIAECHRMGIAILPPDINASGAQYETEKAGGRTRNALRVGLSAIKSVGESAVAPVVAERVAHGPYASISDFCRRADVAGLNRRTLEAMAAAGAFDSLAPRNIVIDALDRIWNMAQQETRSRNSGQAGMFGAADDRGDENFGAGDRLLDLDAARNELTPQEKAELEREYLGFALSYDPLRALSGVQPADGAVNFYDRLPETTLKSGPVALLGHVNSVSERYTRDQRKFLRIDLALVGGNVEVMVWPDSLEQTKDVWESGALVRVSGRLQTRNDGWSLACQEAEPYRLPEDRPEAMFRLPPAARKTVKRAALPEPPATKAAVAPTDDYEDADEAFANGDDGGDDGDDENAAESEGGAVEAGAATGEENAAGDAPPAETAGDAGDAGDGNGPGKSSSGRGKNGKSRRNGNGNGKSKGKGNGKPAPAPAPAGPAAGNGNGNGNGNGHYAGVFLTMRETDDAKEDSYRLRQAIRLMLEYEGDDKIFLELFIRDGRRILLDVPSISTRAADAELHSRLEEMLGAGCVEHRA